MLEIRRLQLSNASTHTGRSMHELSIALSLLEVAAEEAQRRGLRHVAAIRLKLGPLSGVVREALEGAFEMARQTSPLTDCELVIEDCPIIVYCPHCQMQRNVKSIQEICCAICGTPTPNIIGGRELEVVGLEVIDDPPNATDATKTEEGI